VGEVIIEYGNLYLIELPLELKGYRKFIGSWVIKDLNAVVDVGPASTVKTLKRALDSLGVKVEYVLLTHIHLDHAGGIGHFLRLYPKAKVVVHERGVRHLVNPEKLWEASKRVLGEVALAYGRPLPIPEENIAKPPEGIEVIETPGHASHHQSYLFGEYLFTGDSAGVYLDVDGEVYLRPATPPKFIKELYIESLEKMISLGSKKICFAHFGMLEYPKILERHKEQVELWVEVVRRNMGKGIDSIIEELLERDELLKPYEKLEEDIKFREMQGIVNSIKGIMEYLGERNEGH